MPDCLFLFSTFNTSNHKTRCQLLLFSLRVIQVLSDEGPSTVPQSSIDGIPDIQISYIKHENIFPG